MKLKKILASALVAVAAVTSVASLTSCGKKDDTPTTDATDEIEAKLQKAIDGLSLKSSYDADFTLDTTAAGGVTISWASDKTDVISFDNGNATVKRPGIGQADATVKITATAVIDGETKIKEFTVTVPAVEDNAKTVAEIKQLELGASVAAKGVVTGFVYAQDDTDVRSGFYLTDATGTIYVFGMNTAAEVEEGDEIYFTGTYDCYFGSPQIKSPNDLVELGTGKTADYSAAIKDKTVTDIVTSEVPSGEQSTTPTTIHGNVYDMIVYFEKVEGTGDDGGYITYRICDPVNQDNYANIYFKNSPDPEVNYEFTEEYEEYANSYCRVKFVVNGTSSSKKWRGHILEFAELTTNEELKVDLMEAATDIPTSAFVPADGLEYTLPTVTLPEGYTLSVTSDKDCVTYANSKISITRPAENTTAKITLAIKNGETVVAEYSVTIELSIDAINITDDVTIENGYINIPYNAIVGNGKYVINVATDKKIYIEWNGHLDQSNYNEVGLSGGNAIKITAEGVKLDALISDIFGTYDNMKCYVGTDNTGTAITAVKGTDKGTTYTYLFDTAANAIYFENDSTHTVSFYDIQLVTEGSYVEPEEPEVIESTIANAITIGSASASDVYTTDYYKLTGEITEVKNATYGNVVISDGTNSILIYGLYDGEGTRYDSMTTKPVVGDTIVVQGVLGNYNGTVQIKDGTLLSLTPGEGDPETPEVPATPTDITSKVEIDNGIVSIPYNAITANGKYTITLETGKVITIEWAGFEDKSNYKEIGISGGNAIKITTEGVKLDALVSDVYGTHDNMKCYVGTDNTGTAVTAATGTDSGKTYTYLFTDAAEAVYFLNDSTYSVAFYDLQLIVEGTYDYLEAKKEAEALADKISESYVSAATVDLSSTVGTVNVTIQAGATTLAYADNILTITPTTTETTETLTISVTVGEKTYTTESISITSKIPNVQAGTFDKTVQHSSSTTTNMTDGNNAETVGLSSDLFTVTSIKNGQSNHIGLNKDGTMRLYAGSTNGASLVISANTLTGYETVINKIVITFGSEVVDFTINGVKSTKDITEYTINSSSVTIQNVATTGQVHIKSIAINYTVYEGEAPDTPVTPDEPEVELEVIEEDTTITFNATGSYKNQSNILDYTNITIDDSEAHSQVKDGSMSFKVKSGAKVVVNGTYKVSYTLSDGTTTTDTITELSYTYNATSDVTLVLTPVDGGNNYLTSIEVTYPVTSTDITSDVTIENGIVSIPYGTITADGLYAITVETGKVIYIEWAGFVDISKYSEFGVSAGNAIKITTEGIKLDALISDVYGDYNNMKCYVGADNTGTKITPTTGKGSGIEYTYVLDTVESIYYVNDSNYEVDFFDLQLVVEGSYEAPTTVEATIEEANTIGANKYAINGSTTQKYKTTGVITEIKSTTYGNLYISDGENTIYVYGLYDAEGNRYDAMTTKPAVGDTIVIEGSITQFSGVAQFKSATLVSCTTDADAYDRVKILSETNRILALFKESYSEVTTIEITSTLTTVKVIPQDDATTLAFADGVLTITPTENEVTETVTLSIVSGSAVMQKTVSIKSQLPAEGAVVTANATLSFDTKDNRTSFSEEQQVWEQNGIKFTNDKSSSTTKVADYAGPVRLYKSSKVTIEHTNNISVIKVTCNSNSYATDLQKTTMTGATATVDGKVVTITLTTPATSFVIEALGAQVRVDSIEVVYIVSE